MRNKTFTVVREGGTDYIYGDDWVVKDNGILCITENNKVVAVFRKWIRFTVD